MEAVPLKATPVSPPCTDVAKVLSDAALKGPGATARLILPATGAGLEYAVLICVIREPVMNGPAECLPVLGSRLGC